MNKRDFIKTSGTLAIGAFAASSISCGPEKKPEVVKENKQDAVKNGDFKLPELPYSYDSLAPYIDARTMEIHHSKHHAGYVRKLNNAISNTKFSDFALDQIILEVDEDPKNDSVRNNAGGHYNHSLFWEIMTPSNNAPAGFLLDKINESFGSIESMLNEFTESAKSVFGSGWAWLCSDNDKNLFISNTENQDNPMMSKIVERNGIPILGIDVWEHAYYLKYQNKRGEYIDNFIKLVNWEKVSQNLKDTPLL